MINFRDVPGIPRPSCALPFHYRNGPYYASYVLLASFVLVNVLIGVVLTSLEEAKDMDEEVEPPRARRLTPEPQEEQLLLQRIEMARRALDDLERDIARSTDSVPLRVDRRENACQLEGGT
ncbi:hypothetical protein [Streptomyces nigra]|uniref:hypothetical protein n=1 Tax=Streptomyces nigra TaxID=1827580 RepID=UPI00367C48AE